MKGRGVKRPKILFVAQDAGAFNALVPAVEKMRRRWKVLAVLKRAGDKRVGGGSIEKIIKTMERIASKSCKTGH